MQTGVRTDDSGFVFARPDGSPIHPDYFSQTFDWLLAKLDLPRIRLHDLRHTHATLLIKAGVPVKVVSDASATPASRSPCRSTNTSSPACKPTRPQHSARSCSGMPTSTNMFPCSASYPEPIYSGRGAMIPLS